MIFSDLKIGSVYRAKHPKFDGLFNPLVKDRQIIHITSGKHPVKQGKNFIFTKEYKEWFEKNKSPFEVMSEELIQMRYETETESSCIEWDYVVQYDTPGGLGKRYPKTFANKFLKWAHEDVTEKMPKGEWATTI